MVVLAVYVLVLAGMWWVWLHLDSGRPSPRATAPALPPPGAPTPPDLRQHARPAPRRDADGPPLSEDDVIAFGLALEGTDDVVRWATADSSRAATEPRVRPDVAGSS